ncbi:hypothetical protein ISS30_08430 [bacterium]|nr:hypothetical protein [FCB group bacterium]MBL7191709.1 hypothetical protein [bacterium]
MIRYISFPFLKSNCEHPSPRVFFRRCIVILIISLVSAGESMAIGPNFDYYTKIKLEYQYSDYLSYEYPPFIPYEYPDQNFRQPLPFLADFPERRYLCKVTQAFGPDVETALKYQHSDLDDGRLQRLYNGRGQYDVNDNFSVNGSLQYTISTSDTGDLKGYMVDGGCKYDFGGFTMIEPGISVYFNEVSGANQNSYSFNLKLRQALTNSTAFQLKHNYFTAESDKAEYHFNTLTCWLSQWLPTQTAAHLSMRYHWDSISSVSYAPGLEVIQYLDWATLLTVSYRHFEMTSDQEEFLERLITGDYFISDSFSVILTRTMWNDTVFMLKYRYYTGNQDTDVNTYLIGIEQVF